MREKYGTKQAGERNVSMTRAYLDKDFYKGKKVLVTGHTGFKGAWMCKVLLELGAEVTGYALKPPTETNLFELAGVESHIRSVEGDIRDIECLKSIFQEVCPEIVIHMAAQPLVRESYKNPVYTYDVNVMGTVNVLECVRLADSVRSFVNVTTDKVYKNKEWEWGYRENEELNGYDPYSNSKSCSELVTESYKNSFLAEKTAVSTARAGNVIGGGDFAKDRILPDCLRAVQAGKEIVVRNPYSVRPYQHVLEPVMAYLLIAQEQYRDKTVAGNYNIGPSLEACMSTGELVESFCRHWREVSGKEVRWRTESDGSAPHEAGYLKLDCSRMKAVFGWESIWGKEEMMQKTVEWMYAYVCGEDAAAVMKKQIEAYFSQFFVLFVAV